MREEYDLTKVCLRRNPYSPRLSPEMQKERWERKWVMWRGYCGSVEYSQDDGVYVGKVQGIRSLISYEGSDTVELIEDFHKAVDDYLDLCAAEGICPEKPAKSERMKY